jgi:NAD kinase
MLRTQSPRVVVVTRATEYEQLIARHGTRDHARFFLETRGQSLETVFERHRRFEEARATVLQGIPLEWRRTQIDRGDLDRFLFQPDDVVAALGQDGLVANTAKYLDGQAVVGFNPQPDEYEGVLVPHPPQAAADLLPLAMAGRGTYEQRTMVTAELDDGQSLTALNEIFIGHRTHQSARYELSWLGRSERHSSSGMIVSTGTGATGWARSIHRERSSPIVLPQPTEPRLVFFVREPWPSVNTGCDLDEGVVDASSHVEIVSRMNSEGVIFGDGIEADRLEFNWGRRATLKIAARRLKLLRGA